MIRMLIHLAINIASAAVGLLVAAWLLQDFHLEPAGFLVAVGVFAAVQALVGPFVFNMARKYASALLGGIGLVSTGIALWVASLFPGGITVSGFTTWVLAALVVWLITALGGWFLVWFVLKRGAQNRRAAA
jgi:uncharacterized membrane protein YvlD (DUF360 family)